MATVYAKGTKALSICDRCGFTFLYNTMKKELSGIWVCADCYDGKYQLLNHPQNFAPKNLGPDGVLERPRPDAVMEPAPTITPDDCYRI